MTPISVVIITYNEERNIERCLKSVQEIADEIVVLDSGSTDATKSICEKYGVKFYVYKFDGHIQQKNRAITYATHPHVLSLDADEALDDTLKKSILEVKNNFVKDGYAMNRLTNYCGAWIKHCGWYPDTKLRLWDSRKGTWKGINPHDRYELEKGCTEGKLKGDILHYSYYTVEDHYKQVQYFTDISAKAYFEKGKKAGFLKMYYAAVFKFIRDYFIKLGFLDGIAGYRVCRISAYATYLKYRKLKALQTNNPQP